MFRRGLIALVAAAALGIAGCSSNDGAFPLSGQRASVQPTTPAAASATVASTEPSPSPTAARPLPASEPDSGETLSATPPLTAEPQPATAVPAAQAPVQPAPSPRAEPDGAPQLPATRVLPALPGGWPSTFELGMGNKLGVAATMTATAQFGFRYKYLTGGAGTGAGWRFWEHSESDPPGAFVTKYLAESQREGLRSVFTYYMLRQARPDIASDLEALAAVTADPTASAPTSTTCDSSSSWRPHPPER